MKKERKEKKSVRFNNSIQQIHAYKIDSIFYNRDYNAKKDQHNRMSKENNYLVQRDYYVRQNVTYRALIKTINSYDKQIRQYNNIDYTGYDSDSQKYQAIIQEYQAIIECRNQTSTKLKLIKKELYHDFFIKLLGYVNNMPKLEEMLNDQDASQLLTYLKERHDLIDAMICYYTGDKDSNNKELDETLTTELFELDEKYTEELINSLDKLCDEMNKGTSNSEPLLNKMSVILQYMHDNHYNVNYIKKYANKYSFHYYKNESLKKLALNHQDAANNLLSQDDIASCAENIKEMGKIIANIDNLNSSLYKENFNKVEQFFNLRKLYDACTQYLESRSVTTTINENNIKKDNIKLLQIKINCVKKIQSLAQKCQQSNECDTQELKQYMHANCRTLCDPRDSALKRILKHVANVLTFGLCRHRLFAVRSRQIIGVANEVGLVEDSGQYSLSG